MDIGLYTLKYPFRKLIGFLLPLVKDLHPNTVSWMLLPVGALMSWIFYQGMETHNAWFFLAGTFLGFVRMIIATLDGLMAVTYNKSSKWGDLVNRITPELCDLMLIPVIVWHQGNLAVAVAALTLAWATPFIGYVGAAAGLNVQSVGPVGQTDRLAALMLFSFLQFFSLTFHWEIDFINYFLGWLLIGGPITIALRFYRHRREALKADGVTP